MAFTHQVFIMRHHIVVYNNRLYHILHGRFEREDTTIRSGHLAASDCVSRPARSAMRESLPFTSRKADSVAGERQDGYLFFCGVTDGILTVPCHDYQVVDILGWV